MYIIESPDSKHIFGLIINNSSKKNYNALTFKAVIITEKDIYFNRDLSREDEKRVIEVFEKNIFPSLKELMK